MHRHDDKLLYPLYNYYYNIINNIEELTEDGISHLNVDQRAAFEEIIAAVEAKTSVTFFVDGPGGTGKTFLYK